jgi:hypothetical protein
MTISGRSKRIKAARTAGRPMAGRRLAERNNLDDFSAVDWPRGDLAAPTRSGFMFSLYACSRISNRRRRNESDGG